MPTRQVFHNGVLIEEVEEPLWVSTEEAIATLTAQIYHHAAGLLDRTIAQYSSGEVASWTTKEQQARRYLETGNEADAPILAIEAQSANRPLGELAATIVAKSDYYYRLVSTVSGTRTKHLAAIAQLSDAESVMNYDWSKGWEVTP